MLAPFSIALREALQCVLLASLVLLSIDPGENNRNHRVFFLGLSAALLTGFGIGFTRYFAQHGLAKESWTFLRYCIDSAVFYLGALLVFSRHTFPRRFTVAGLFALGFVLVFFEARSLGFLVYDIGAMNGVLSAALVSGVAGLAAGFAPLAAVKRFESRLTMRTAFTVPTLLITVGALRFAMGGVGELEKDNILIPLQRGFMKFMEGTVTFLKELYAIPSHPFMPVPFSALAEFFSGDRMALALTIVFLMTPPIVSMTRIFGRPDPVVSDTEPGAKKRRKIAFFNKELIAQSAPALIAFALLAVLLHAVNVSMNPLFDPPPVPLRESDGVVTIHLSDKTGDLSDKKLRKYVFYWGTNQIIFLAILRPDGTLGIALDECEICRPASWNVDAKGYAQRGDHLVCKYCMTPIAAATVNNPGGCNPIPVPFKAGENRVTITVNDLTALYQKVQELEKKGTHF